MVSPEEWRFQVFGLLPHPEEAWILVQECPQGYTLPNAIVSEDGPTESAFVRALREQLGVDAWILRNAWQERSSDERLTRRIYVMENRSPAWEPTCPCLWIKKSDELKGVSLAFPELRPVLQAWFEERGSGQIPPQRPAWAKPGWEDSARAWIEAEVSRAGCAGPIRVEQVKTWAISTVLKISAGSETFFFKAVPPFFAVEPRLTRALYRDFPAGITPVVAIHPTEPWMLMRPFAGIRLEESREPGDWERAIQLLARIQTHRAGHPEELLQMGCPDRQIHLLPGEFITALEWMQTCGPWSEEWNDRRNNDGLKEEQAVRLRELLPEVQRLCEELGACGVPETLLHGDLHAGNVMVEDGLPLIFDWTDGALSHPFFDVTLLLNSEALPPEWSERVVGAYFDVWSLVAPRPQLQKAFALAKKLSPLYHACSYYRIESQTERSEPDLSGATGFLLKRFEEKLAQASEE